jgi:manganese-dependent inorganic pyrophosphatase
MAAIKVIGHINPDTDSTCTPSIYAWYLKEKKGLDAKVYVANEPNKEALYLLERFKFDKPEILKEIKEDDKLVIIDTNNADELIEGYDKAEILEIIDHHKLFGNVKTSSPVQITMRPVACVATIVWGMMKAGGATDVPENVAGMLLGSILSDTLNYTSPTTTQEDRDAGKELADIAKVDSNELAAKMFEAKSDLSGMNADDILHMDSKIFVMEGKQIRVSTLETTNTGLALGMSADIKKRMEELKNEESLDMVLFFVVDIINSSANALVTNEEEKKLIEKAFNVEFTSETVNLPGVVSRKKQMIPAIEKALK